MAADAVYDAIKTHLSTPANVAGLADATTLVVPSFRFENDGEFIPPKDSTGTPIPWISMALARVLYGQTSIGENQQANNNWEETGQLVLSVFVPVGSGGSRARQLAKLLADIFRGLRLLSDKMEFLDAGIGGSGPAPEEGNWYQLDVVIDWRHVEA